MKDDTPYIIGRRAGGKHAVSLNANLRAEDSGLQACGTGGLRMWGWTAATFGAGAILGWMVR